MPSPLAHTAAGYAIAKVLLHRYQKKEDNALKKNYQFIIAAIILSLLPDLDAGVGILLGDFGRYHNNISHSLVFALGASFLIGIFMNAVLKGRFWLGFITTLSCYSLHIAMDFVTYGRGVMVFWPFTSQRFQSDMLLFYGLHWSDGFFSVNHLITLANEILFITILIWVLNWTINRKSQPNELIEQASKPEKDGVA
jgi:hypothetical protein